MKFSQLPLWALTPIPGHVYTIGELQHYHAIVYETARKDLLALAEKMGLLLKLKQGKRFVFIAPGDLGERLQRG